jgi:hypothetical protein
VLVSTISPEEFQPRLFFKLQYVNVAQLGSE